MDPTLDYADDLSLPDMNDTEQPADPLQRAVASLNQLNERALTFARERPVTCIIGAVALGFVIGKIAARY